jgi:tetratricopeptide (TPR) repeat protein
MPLRNPFGFAALSVVMWLGSGVALGQEPRPTSGLFHSRTTPCLLAKYRGGTQCEPPALPAVDDPAAQATARKARAHFFADMEQLPLAMSEAEAALALDRNDADALHLVARLAMSARDDQRAERELGRALGLRPNDPDIRATWAQFLEMHGAIREAEREYSKVLGTQPANRFARIARAKLHLTAGEVATAIHDLNVLLNDKRETNLLALRAKARLETNEPKKALDDLNDALTIEPKRHDLVGRRAAVHETMGNDEAALQDLERILGPLGGNPRFAIGGNELAHFRLQRAMVLRRLGLHADAAAEALHAIQVGGPKTLLRTQTFLRRNGFPETPLDGRVSHELKTSLQACLGLNSCFQDLIDNI